MDYLRSCYTCNMRFGPDDDQVLPVRWYFVPEGTVVNTPPHNFFSQNWQERNWSDGQIGEFGATRPWINGSTPLNGFMGPSGNGRACFDSFLEAWEDGLLSGETTGPFDADGKPLCCIEGPPPPPFDCMEVADTLTASFVSLSGCGSIEGTVVLSRVPTFCTWTGFKPVWTGSALVTLEYLDGDWLLTIDCFTGQPVVTVVDFSPSPFHLVFDVEDTAACCSFSGSDSFRVEVTE